MGPGPNGFPSHKCPKCGELIEGLGPATLTIAMIAHNRDKHGGPDFLREPGRMLPRFAKPVEAPEEEQARKRMEEAEDIRQKLLPLLQEPWKCQACGLFVYNRDESGNAVIGAPTSKWFSAEYARVCSCCYDMLLNLIAEARRGYWQDIDRAEKEWNRKEQERLKKLRPGNDYFAGA